MAVALLNLGMGNLNMSHTLTDIPTVYPVLQTVRSNLTTDECLAMTDDEFNAYIDAQYGDDDD